MAYEIRYSNVSSSNALRKGDFDIGVNNVAYGPTSVTGFYKGGEPPSGGYVIYLNKGSGGPATYILSNEAELINVTREASGITYSTAQECIQWFSTQSDKLVISNTDQINNVDTDNLVLSLNAASNFSYPTTGSTWYDVSGNSNNVTLYNSPAYQFKSINFDGTDDYSRVANNILYQEFTLEATIKINSDSYYNYIISNSRDCCGSYGGYNLKVANNLMPRFDVWNGNVFAITGSTITLNKPYTLQATYDGTWQRLYQNGELITEATNSAGVGSPSYGLVVGGLAVNPGIYKFRGNIYDVKIYSKALTSQEIKQNYFQAPIVTDGLTLALDASNIISYNSGSLTTYSLTGSYSGSLINGTGFDKGNGGSWDFDGTNDYIGLSNDFISTFGSSNQNTTISVWINWTSTTLARIVNFYRTTNLSTALALAVNTINGTTNNAGYVGLLLRNSSNTAHVWSMYTGETYNTGDWVNVVVTTTSTENKVYVNGVLKKTDSTGLMTISSATSTGTIGCYGPAQDGIFNGKIADVKCYDYTLTSQEIKQNFEAHRKRFGI